MVLSHFPSGILFIQTERGTGHIASHVFPPTLRNPPRTQNISPLVDGKRPHQAPHPPFNICGALSLCLLFYFWFKIPPHRCLRTTRLAAPPAQMAWCFFFRPLSHWAGVTPVLTLIWWRCTFSLAGTRAAPSLLRSINRFNHDSQPPPAPRPVNDCCTAHINRKQLVIGWEFTLFVFPAVCVFVCLCVCVFVCGSCGVCG